MAASPTVRRFIRPATIGALVVLGHLAGTPAGAFAATPAPAETGVVQTPSSARADESAPIVGGWEGSLGGQPAALGVGEVSPSRFRATAISPAPGCRVFDVSGSGNLYKGFGYLESCDGTGPTFDLVVEIHSNGRGMTIRPLGDAPIEPMVFVRSK
ncbi:hypothetical protein [Actinomadura sp. HBU206391]|uniref:hypothetical protein n=1 Tax=Actinomadura sp. HBU206391 TaxID=2731692 RepID=UPI00164FD558|nr:hypothetical protein [Actinomadura sp. HBU206391]MBC6459114.1 hypothetical protein [Actinomadura sp. HBU206391]